MKLDDKVHEALEAIAELRVKPLQIFDNIPLVMAHHKELEARGLIECAQSIDIVAQMKKEPYELRCRLTSAGARYLQEHKKRECKEKIKQWFSKNCGEILKYVLCAVITAVTWEFIRRYFGFN